MLFNSYEFILLFLPVVVLGYFSIRAIGGMTIAIPFLTAASLFFYGWWNPLYLPLLAASIIANYWIGRGLCRSPGSKIRLLSGIMFNLLLLGYFKYSGFLVENVNLLTSWNLSLQKTVLPLAISFFTFQQIAYLVDAYRGEVEEHGLLEYALFVSFFPQLIAGPIVHHKQMVPQFSKRREKRFSSEELALGLTVFTLGLFKKVVLADSIATYASPVFESAASGAMLQTREAWAGALSYAFQIYFDFSGYSDMAVGAALLFGIRIPLNFDSPYKSCSIIEFWRRWHITLSRFLRDYVYFPLGGNRKGSLRRYLNVLAVMLLGGIWHGAGWNFALWGAIHGGYLVVNHGWRAAQNRLGAQPIAPSWLLTGLSWILTSIAVVIGWVFFRAPDVATALSMLESMFIGASQEAVAKKVIDLSDCTWWLVASAAICVCAPNVGQWAGLAPMSSWLERPRRLRIAQLARFEMKPAWAVALGLLFTMSLLTLTRVSEFLYFQF